MPDLEVKGGRESNVTLGLNWYLNRNVRFMFNAIFVYANLSQTNIRDEPDLFQFRTQIVF